MAKRNNAYWQKRMEALEDEQYRRAEAYYRDVQEQFYKASDSIQRDIERWWPTTTGSAMPPPNGF